MTYSELDMDQDLLTVVRQMLMPKTIQEGFLIFLNRLYQQQQGEMDILDKRADYPHLSDYELLTEYEIRATL